MRTTLKAAAICWLGCCGFAWAGDDGALAAPAVTNVAAFFVQVTNEMSFALVPATNLCPTLDAPAATNAPVVAMGATNEVVAPPPPDEATTNLIQKAALDAVAVAVKSVNDAAEKSMEAERQRRIDTRTFRLRHVSATEVAERFNNTWSGDFGLPWKISKIAQAFVDANTVMVTAPGVVLDSCEKVIREIDVAPRQVYIEVRFVELGNTAMHRLGIDWTMLEGMTGTAKMGMGIDSYDVGRGVQNYTKTTGGSEYEHTSYSLAGGTVSSSSGTFKGGSDGSISHFTGTLDFNQMSLTLSALERENDTRVFSNPKIIVASGRKATVDMTTKYPNVTIAAKKTINNNNESVDLDMKMAAIPGEDQLMFAKEAFFSWGLSLEVTPRVGEDGLVNVSIVPTISSLTSDSAALGGQFVTAGTSSDLKSDTYSSKYPIIDVQRLVTDFSMKDGMTAVIGGLSRTQEVQIDSGIPWLRDCPWIGNKLFGGKTRQKVQKEIIVFVTVGLVEDDVMPTDVGLPKNAVLGREYVNDARREPGDRKSGAAGISSLDLRSLEEQAADPRRTNRLVTARGEIERL
ncbi:MAG: type II secretion system protein GspD, partial [Kiritimatiellia bacterium]